MADLRGFIKMGHTLHALADPEAFRVFFGLSV